MSIHVFGALATHHGTAANNRGENEGNMTTLQKLLWKGDVHTTVSAEAIRFALRRLLGNFEPTNRTWDDNIRANTWTHPNFENWKGINKEVHIDDDLLGFMSPKAGKEEGSAGTADVRRAVLEIARAISLIPWSGDTVFNAASPGATPAAAKKGSNPVPYGAEIHATRYQYGFAMTPARLRKSERASIAIKCLCSLAEVAGNHGRFLYDFSPESVVFRITDDPAPRLLYCFEADGSSLKIPSIVSRVKSGDIDAKELIIGGAISESPDGQELKSLGAEIYAGVRKAGEVVAGKIAKAKIA